MISQTLIIFIFLASIVGLIVMITRFRVHPFFALLFTAIFLGLASGLSPKMVIEAVTGGFGKIMGHIGIVIVCGVIIGEILERAGGALKIANSVLKVVGKKRTVLAASVTGAVVSVPVFCDSGFVVLNPVIKGLSRAGKIPYISLATALMAGLLVTHCLIPPTPGPIAAAGILGADLGKIFLLGGLVCIPIILVSTFWANSGYLKTKYPQTAPEESEVEVKTVSASAAESIQTPSTLMSFLPIVVPILLIVLFSVGKPFLPEKGRLILFLGFIGNPIIALLVGLLISFLLPGKKRTGLITNAVTSGMEKSAAIILITAAGGSFGAVLQQIGIGSFLGETVANLGMPSLLIPFTIAALSLTAQGSATVALVTSASIIKPMLGSLGLSPEFAFLAIGVGAFTVAHPNGSYFWVVSNMCKMDMKQSLWAVTVTTGIMGLTGFCSVQCLYWISGLI